MVLNSKPVLKWFGYSRRERRSTFILLIIIVLVIAFRYIVPQRNINIEDISATLRIYDESAGNSNEIKRDSVKLFAFDPNKASVTALKNLGLSDKQAATVKNFRDKGGRFRHPSDFSRIYGIDTNLLERLIPYIIISNDSDSGPGKSLNQIKMIDLNSCDSIMLDKLPGIGRILSVRIIKYRNLLGGFFCREQLKEVYGLSLETYNRIADRVFADSSLVTHININIAGYKDLLKHPYLDRFDVQSILKYRELKGKIKNINELTDNKILTPEKSKRISPYLSFGK